MTPQEKKRLSYERDRRNAYGENDKASRKNIPRSKRLAVRSARRFVSLALVVVRGAGYARGVVGPSTVVDGAPADRVGPRIAGRRPAVFRKWPDEPLGDVVAGQLSRRAGADPAGAPTADARIRRVERTLRRRTGRDATDVGQWLSSLATIDRQIRLCDGDRKRGWVSLRLAQVRAAERAGAFTPYDSARHDAQFLAGLYRDGIAAAVADLLPAVDDVVRTGLARIPVSEREVRAARTVDADRIRDARRLVDAVGPLAAHVTDPGLALAVRSWRRLTHRR